MCIPVVEMLTLTRGTLPALRIKPRLWFSRGLWVCGVQEGTTSEGWRVYSPPVGRSTTPHGAYTHWQQQRDEMARERGA